MAKAVLAQLKLCNAAVRRKTTKRKIRKQYGGECLTEAEGVARLHEIEEKKRSKTPRVKLVKKLPASESVLKEKTIKNISRPRLVADTSDSDCDITPVANSDSARSTTKRLKQNPAVIHSSSSSDQDVEPVSQ